MAPSEQDSPFTIVRKYPTNRDKVLGTVEDWVQGRVADDGAEGLWRIHDDLYDLSDFIERHPGGRDWLEITKGTDITEAFEVHHVRDIAEKLLPKFHVRKAKEPRNSQVTLKEDGFYKTLKRRLRPLITETGPTFHTKFLTDTFVALVVLCGVLGASYSQYWSILSGIFLHAVIVCAHNFFHMKDNFRMYYFNLSLMSYRDWRISHVLSHHLFPNTVLDLEISMWEPMFQYIPHTNKTFITRYLPWLTSPIMFITMFHLQVYRRVKDALKTQRKIRVEEFASLALPLAIYIFSGAGLWQTFLTWNVIILSASALFGVVGLTAAHHHPDIYHEGDQFTDDKDFAILQLAAVRDRIEVNGNFFLVMVSFGDHALHHMFPTIDHYRLPAFYPVFNQTCKEFGIDYKLYPAKDMFTGMYKQLARNYRNAKLHILKRKKGE